MNAGLSQHDLPAQLPDHGFTRVSLKKGASTFKGNTAQFLQTSAALCKDI